jgi:hypothetical protein
VVAGVVAIAGCADPALAAALPGTGGFSQLAKATRATMQKAARAN